MGDKDKILLFGIGNCGRADDGLGWAFLDRIKPDLPENYDVEYRYQLQIEDAELATHYDKVIFIDAHIDLFDSGFVWEECLPKATDSFTSHELDPRAVLYLSDSIYNKRPQSFTMGISGKQFGLEMGLTATAEHNLSQAIQFFKEKISFNFNLIDN
ncbi:MAG: hydrogenase maturation protease [Eudoraea sp.]|nr:hydrogenase maturation protease [Eudoraea sp.]